MLEIKNITKNFGGIEALSNVSLNIETGKTTALIGPNGAGKTTLFDIVTGLTKPDGGQIFFNKQDVTRYKAYQLAGIGISRIFQQVRLFRNLNLSDHLRLAQDGEDMKPWKFILKKSRSNLLMYKEHLARFGLQKELNTKASHLSYGQRKLLQIAMAMFGKHTLLMLDEPIAGVNSLTQDMIENILLELKNHGQTMILIEHNMDFIKRLADKVVVLDAGHILAQGQPAEVFNNPQVLEAYLGK